MQFSFKYEIKIFIADLLINCKNVFENSSLFQVYYSSLAIVLSKSPNQVILHDTFEAA